MGRNYFWFDSVWLKIRKDFKSSGFLNGHTLTPRDICQNWVTGLKTARQAKFDAKIENREREGVMQFMYLQKKHFYTTLRDVA